jgi:hypothetical protein
MNPNIYLNHANCSRIATYFDNRELIVGIPITLSHI